MKSYQTQKIAELLRNVVKLEPKTGYTIKAYNYKSIRIEALQFQYN